MAALLKRGDRGPEVKRLQEALLRHGFNPGQPDGLFGGGTEAALLAFQRAKGLLPDGVCGARSWAALEAPPAAQPAPATALPSLDALVFPIWLVTHRELRTSRRIRIVFDILAEELGRSTT